MVGHTTIEFSTLGVHENPVFILFCILDGGLLLEIVRQKVKIDVDKQKYVKAAIFFNVVTIYFFASSSILYR